MSAQQTMDQFLLYREHGYDLIACQGDVPRAIRKARKRLLPGDDQAFVGLAKTMPAKSEDLRLAAQGDLAALQRLVSSVHSKWKDRRRKAVDAVVPLLRSPSPLDLFMLFFHDGAAFIERTFPRADIEDAQLVLAPGDYGAFFALGAAIVGRRALRYDTSLSPVAPDEAAHMEIMQRVCDGSKADLVAFCSDLVAKWGDVRDHMRILKEPDVRALPCVPADVPPASLRGMHLYNEWMPEVVRTMMQREADLEIEGKRLEGDVSRCTPQEATLFERRAPEYYLSCKTYFETALTRADYAQRSAVAEHLVRAANFWSRVPYTPCRLSLFWTAVHLLGEFEARHGPVTPLFVLLDHRDAIGTRDLFTTALDPLYKVIDMGSDPCTVPNPLAKFKRTGIPKQLRIAEDQVRRVVQRR